MDPADAKDRHQIPRLPRVSGDGPFGSVVAVAETPVAPRERGWTVG